MNSILRYALAVTSALTLSACTAPASDRQGAAGAASAPLLAPNPNLVVQGIPPIPQSLVQQVARYTDFRGHAFVDWHPQRREMLVAHRKAGGNTSQLFRIAGPLAEPEQLTDFPDPVTRARYEPRDGRYIVFERAAGGSEASQVYRLDLDNRQVALITEPSERHGIEEWLHNSPQLLISSTPLDKTAQGGKRTTITQTLTLVDPASPTSKTPATAALASMRR